MSTYVDPEKRFEPGKEQRANTTHKAPSEVELLHKDGSENRPKRVGSSDDESQDAIVLAALSQGDDIGDCSFVSDDREPTSRRTESSLMTMTRVISPPPPRPEIARKTIS